MLAAVYWFFPLGRSMYLGTLVITKSQCVAQKFTGGDFSVKRSDAGIVHQFSQHSEVEVSSFGKRKWLYGDSETQGFWPF